MDGFKIACKTNHFKVIILRLNSSDMIKYTFITLLVFSSLISFSQSTIQDQTDSVSLDIMIGQMILTGIGDDRQVWSSNPILDEIEKGKVGGVIYFEKNINPKKPVKSLKEGIKKLQEKAEIPLFVSIDEEGGKVNRLKPKYGFPETRKASELGEANNLDSTRFYALTTATTLADLGFNVNFAPDVDVAINPDNPVISRLGRSFSSDHNLVAIHAREVIKAHRENGVITTLKHFPGHGSSHADSHLGVADVTKYWQFSELMTYKYLIDSGEVDAIMSAHIVNKHLDPKGYPATLSPFIISEILRGVLGYQGVVFSDDMQMHAISSNYGFEESVKMAILAGIDVLVFANNVPGNERRSPSELHHIIKSFVTNGDISEQRISESYRRIMKLKSKLQ